MKFFAFIWICGCSALILNRFIKKPRKNGAFTLSGEGWAVGGDNANRKGILLHYSGGIWSSVPPPPVSPDWKLNSVHFTSPGEGWAVGSGGKSGRGVLLHYSDSKWSLVMPPPVSSYWGLTNVHFTSPGEGWAVGFDGVHNIGVLIH